jgi:hypothetical protein
VWSSFRICLTGNRLPASRGGGAGRRRRSRSSASPSPSGRPLRQGLRKPRNGRLRLDAQEREARKAEQTARLAEKAAQSCRNALFASQADAKRAGMDVSGKGQSDAVARAERAETKVEAVASELAQARGIWRLPRRRPRRLSGKRLSCAGGLPRSRRSRQRWPMNLSRQRKAKKEEETGRRMIQADRMWACACFPLCNARPFPPASQRSAALCNTPNTAASHAQHGVLQHQRSATPPEADYGAIQIFSDPDFSKIFSGVRWENIDVMVWSKV